jgi:DNA-binding MarR family transcriptional regulator
MRRKGPLKAELRSLVEADRFLHEPSRSVILAVLSVVEKADFLYLQRETGLSKGNLSVHLTRLEEAGYLSIEKTYRGRRPLTVCRITPEGRTAFENYRQQLKQFIEAARPPDDSKEL